jgi:glycosyltransferase involved in cell wall biosynthesis
MELTVAICTRDRPGLLHATLEALAAQTRREFELVVVDQSGRSDPQLEALPRERPSTTVIRDEGTGLSRARNLALRAARGDWIAFVDDDCVADPDMVEALLGELAAHPEADWVSGDVSAAGAPGPDYLPVTVFPVERAHRRSGRWTIPGRIGFGVFFCVRRATAKRLGGWDERLGPGVPDLPAADDMDFNHRLLKDGGVAWLSPRIRLRHDQWRSPEELAPLQRGYVRAWAGFAMKHLKGGEPLAGLWLWCWGAIDVLHMSASAVRHRSRLRLRLALAKLRGLAEGTAMGAARRW